jgi:hypothetical protein
MISWAYQKDTITGPVTEISSLQRYHLHLVPLQPYTADDCKRSNFQNYAYIKHTPHNNEQCPTKVIWKITSACFRQPMLGTNVIGGGGGGADMLHGVT